MESYNICPFVTDVFHRTVSSGFFRVVVGVRIPFSLKVEQYCPVFIHGVLTTHSSVARACQYLFEIMLWSFGCVTRSGIAGAYGKSMVDWLSNSHTVFHSSHSSHVPTSSAQAFQFLHVLTYTGCRMWFFLCRGHPNGWERVSHCGLDLHVPDDECC